MTDRPPSPDIKKSAGFTETERMLADFCERSFLKLWTYPNPFKDDGHEFCDLIAVFGNYVFIFFDREKELPHDSDKDPQVLWDRWKKRAIDAQTATAHGAERYIRNGRSLFLDGKRSKAFPLAVDPSKAIIHKIIVAHGAKEACERASDQNVYGSLAIAYSEPDDSPSIPFQVRIDKHNPVHVFDSHNLSIILSELDTVTDFANYLDEKLRAIAKYDLLLYCGEEDLLGHYLLNYDEEAKRYIIGTNEPNTTSVMIGEGEWHDFVQSDLYKNTKKTDEVSYLWDELIQRTCQNALEGTLGGNSDLLRGQSAIFEMVKEPRFVRRALANKMREAIIKFPDHSGQMTRHVVLMPSYLADVSYVFLQLRMTDDFRARPEYLDFRRKLLEIACGAAKNKFPHMSKVIGIGMDAPKFAGETNSEDFILMPCETWSDEVRQYYEEMNAGIGFFQSPSMRQYEERVTQFVPPSTAATGVTTPAYKVGRNDPCPCGSGTKFKKCHGK